MGGVILVATYYLLQQFLDHGRCQSLWDSLTSTRCWRDLYVVVKAIPTEPKVCWPQSSLEASSLWLIGLSGSLLQPLEISAASYTWLAMSKSQCEHSLSLFQVDQLADNYWATIILGCLSSSSDRKIWKRALCQMIGGKYGSVKSDGTLEIF